MTEKKLQQLFILQNATMKKYCFIKVSKKLFGYINSRQDSKGPSCIISTSGSKFVDDAGMAAELNQFFYSVFKSPVSNSDPPIPVQILPNCPTISGEEVYNYLNSLKISAPGPDNHHPILIKACASSLSVPLAIIFNKCLIEGVYPSQWKIANVVPIHKGGSSTSATNYRPISLLSVFSKIFEKILHHYLVEWLNVNHPLTESQHGFLKGAFLLVEFAYCNRRLVLIS